MLERPLTIHDLTLIGHGVQQPECVVALASGDVYTADHRGAMARIKANGDVDLTYATGAPIVLRPNGFSILPGRDFLVANIGDDGGVWRISSKGEATPFVTEVERRKLPGTNFVGADASGRAWISISSWQIPRALATRKDAAEDGCILLADDRGVRIAADGLAYTNECRLDPSGDWLYVNETRGRRLTRFRIGDKSELGQRETVTEFTDASFPDGLAFDELGFCWVACIGSQRIIRVDPKTGRQQIIFDESSPDMVRETERKFQGGELRAWNGPDGTVLGSVSGLCFGGPDLKTVYLGSLTRRAIATFRSPIAGAKPHYWNY